MKGLKSKSSCFRSAENKPKKKKKAVAKAVPTANEVENAKQETTGKFYFLTIFKIE